jgi:hypothetical protein
MKALSNKRLAAVLNHPFAIRSASFCFSVNILKMNTPTTQSQVAPPSGLRLRLFSGSLSEADRHGAAALIIKGHDLSISPQERAVILNELIDGGLRLKQSRILPFLNAALQRQDYGPVFDVLFAQANARALLARDKIIEHAPLWAMVLENPAAVEGYLRNVPNHERARPSPSRGGVLHWCLALAPVSAGGKYLKSLRLLISDDWGRSHARAQNSEAETAFEVANRNKDSASISLFIELLPEVIPCQAVAETFVQYLRQHNFGWLPAPVKQIMQVAVTRAALERSIPASGEVSRSRL